MFFPHLHLLSFAIHPIRAHSGLAKVVKHASCFLSGNGMETQYVRNSLGRLLRMDACVKG